MSEDYKRCTFEEISELALLGETSHCELKNSTFLVEEHPLNQGKSRTGKGPFQDKLREMLSCELGAFANSDGGRLIIGFNDNDKTLDPVPIPAKRGNTLIEKWLEDFVRNSLDPKLEVFNCYSIDTNCSGVVVVVDVPRSEKAPHQSLDMRYYIRQCTSAVQADHWMIEMIRNRRVYPLVKVDMDIEGATVSQVLHSGEPTQLKLYMRLPVTLKNEGSLILKEWAVLFESCYANINNLHPQSIVRRSGQMSVGDGFSSFYVAERCFYPSQEINLELELLLNFKLRDNSLRACWTGMRDLPPHEGGTTDDGVSKWFVLRFTCFMEGPPVKKQWKIYDSDLNGKITEWIRENPRCLER